MNCDFTHRSGKGHFRNPANTFSYNIVAAAIAGDRNLNLPLLTADDTLVCASFANTWVAAQKMETYTDVKEITEPSSPASGYKRLYVDSTTHKLSIKNSSGDVVVLE